MWSKNKALPNHFRVSEKNGRVDGIILTKELLFEMLFNSLLL